MVKAMLPCQKLKTDDRRRSMESQREKPLAYYALHSFSFTFLAGDVAPTIIGGNFNTQTNCFI